MFHGDLATTLGLDPTFLRITTCLVRACDQIILPPKVKWHFYDLPSKLCQLLNLKQVFIPTNS